MLFNSPQFLIFLPAVLLLRWGFPRHSLVLLLVASYVFYASGSAWFLPYLIGLTLANYALGRALDRRRWRHFLLVIALVLNVGTLALFKYANWLTATLTGQGLMSASTRASFVAPLAISFFTFEFVHYAVDVFRGSKAVKSLLHFGLFATFFPSQIAGPIKRYQQFVPQLAGTAAPKADELWEGAGLVARGFVKKVVFADNLALLSNSVFAANVQVGNLSILELLLGIYGFAWQIYFDFSGYTDIGRGVARWLGFQLPENFASPYTSPSFRVFWRRWHMTLSLWLRDYLYIPLGGSRVARWRIALNVMATMVLGGLWHGAGLQFAVWGAYHGLLLVLNAALGGLRPAVALARLPGSRVLGAFVTFNLVSLGWVFFRAGDLSHALAILGRFVTAPLVGATQAPEALMVPILLLLVGAAGSVLGRYWDVFLPQRRVQPAYRFAALAATGFLLYAFAREVREPFIYFQF